MLNRLRKSLAEANYGLLGLELFLVVAGILIAFQIDRWAEERRDREQEYEYVLRLKEDLLTEVNIMTQSIQYAEERLEDVRLLENVSTDPELARSNPSGFLMALEQVTWRSYPQISANVYEELRATGGLSLIRSDDLRHDLSNYYSFYDHYSVIGFDLELQSIFSRLTAGLLSTAELTIIQGNRQQRQNWRVSPDRANEVARVFSQHPEAIKLLPSIAQHHVHNQRFVGLNRDRANQLVATIEALVQGFER